MDKIANISKWIKGLLALLAISQLGSYIAVMTMGDYQDGIYFISIDWWGAFQSYLSIDFAPSWQSLGEHLYADGFHPGLILSSVELIPYLFIYFFLFQLFSLYQNGQVFTSANFHCLTRIATVFFVWILLSLFYPLLVAFFLRSTGMSDTVPGFLTIGSQEVEYALMGLIFYCIGWVMKHAAELQTEAELTI
ncbi:DUF2975 domain-containing protein [Shewanella livingstonensis]|uniref:DUF2975 domain-containing protein n=1 Tax=Shewanella livingstonensis TaxID=150120 RepID=A0A3G8LNG2_9GAMM|nr:DUF2975 domain-containing protein [Shewanella livingstonensis]AZG71316.1 DUF2975 domain-containing protein [Shewanella livingstonensis]